MSLPETEVLTDLVARVFRVESVTRQETRHGMQIRYSGAFIGPDTAAAHARLTADLRPYGISAHFRRMRSDDFVVLVPAGPEPRPGRPSVNILLFVLTVLSVMLAGSFMSVDQSSTGVGDGRSIVQRIASGWPFAASLLGILLAHEFGHYLMSRHHGTPATLPYFIPFPFSPLGTMGAFISMQAVPRNKRVLFDIGVAGPLAGLVVAIPVLLLGLSLSSISTIEPNPGGFLEGNSILYLLAKYAVFGRVLPSPAGGDAGLLYWAQYIITGRPVPYGGLDVFIHPVAFAGWAGLLVTALNLLPAGTLDGGHVVYSVLGEKASRAFPFVLGGLLVLGWFWSGWWLWALLLVWLGRVHVEPLDQVTPLNPARKLVAALVMLVFILVFSPVPFMPLGS